MSIERRELSYSDSGVPVRLGDSVRIKRFLRKPLEGTVHYLPGQSPPHPEMEDEGVHQWAIRLDNGDLLISIFHPETVPLDRRIRLVARASADYQGLQPSERTVEDDYYEDPTAGRRCQSLRESLE